jgi:hypothetical protein
MIVAPSPSDQHIDDEIQTLTKFQTFLRFQVGISLDVFSFFILQIFFFISTGRLKKCLMLGLIAQEVLKMFYLLAMVELFTILSALLNCPSS